MRRTVFILVIALTYAAGLNGDSFDYGSPEELKGVKLFFIDAGEDLDLRDIIAERLTVAGVKAVERPEDATHWIIFRWNGSQPHWTRTIIVKQGSSRPRLLLTYRGTEAELDDLASDAGKAIAKRLRSINDGR